ncbi:CDP-Glycerol:Poly(glycerophosphate) glycerophosphotransferase [Paenibacillus polysaccharolyticus]|uniref:CDP-Glycerol:Poly(Glycerophosphate) glycerophosphotransferase n=1 Tax=Paenibacillus polysaccharolyticus TaxID=582692 RepID=A0A1G5KBT8_9BACL|nr:CDP-glycerol glycerophosphotransferase family protein [Paenibacillus polysaccharolyticus]SCY98083.1 CDP-Glycerol:Poly(glycerophosphate) glycerophosphotransferase [Paenibacillus polysaccharolyticus]
MKFIIFGAGLLGKSYYTLLKDKYDINCFADSNSKKHGTKLFDLPIIQPGEIIEKGLNVIIASNSHLEIAQQLYAMGIKEFYIPNKYGTADLTRVDLSEYGTIREKPNKICVIGHYNAGAVSNALSSNPYDDIEVVLVKDSKRDKEYYYHYLSSSLIITHSGERCGNKKSIELWHGFTIKTIFYMNKEENDRNLSDSRNEIFQEKSAICSMSHLYSIFVGYCLKLDFEKFVITGYPRNDMIFKSDGKRTLEKLMGPIKQRKILFYAPTHRDSFLTSNGNNAALISDMDGYNEKTFNDFLSKNDILFLYKKHTVQLTRPMFDDSDHIKEITDEMLHMNDMDLYEILNGVDGLISDYSSIIIDFLLTDKPIILTPLDLEDYSQTRGLMMEPYDAWMPGEIALEYSQFEQAVIDSLYGEDKFKKDRERLKRITHKYADGNSSQRVLALARELLELEDTNVRGNY